MRIKFTDYQLRDWQVTDVAALQKHANNRKIWRHLRDGFPNPYDLVDAEAFIAHVLSRKPQTNFAIAIADEVIGSIGFSIKTDIQRFTAELGYWLAEPYWNQGIMTEAVRLLSSWVFDQFGLVRICAEPMTTNTASIKVLEKAGFLFEGTLKKSAFKDSKFVDQKLYALINIVNSSVTESRR